MCYVRKDIVRDLETNKIFAANATRFESLRAGKKHHLTTQRGYKTYMSKYHDLQYTKNFMQKKYFDAINVTE